MEQGVISMSKKALLVIMAAALALTVLGVAAQDSGHGVTNVTLPDGRSVPVFTDGRLNAFDIGAPVVVFYTAANGNIVNPDIAPGTQPDLNSLNFSNSNTLNTINTFMSNGNNNAANSTNNSANSNTSGNNAANSTNNSANSNTSGNNNAASNGNNGSTTANQSNQAGLISHLQVLAVGSDSGTALVLNPSVEDLLSLVTGQQKSLAAQGYTVNFDAAHNYFWVQAPADFEGKVYSFAWPNNIFPTNLIGQTGIRLTTSQLNSANANSNANANSTGNSNAQTTTQSGNQGSSQATAQPTSQGNGNGSGQATAQPTTQATSQPAQPTATP